MFRILAALIAFALATAPITASAQSAEAAGTPRVVYHPPAPEPRDQRPRARDARRRTARATLVSHPTPTQPPGARAAHTSPTAARPRR